MGYPNWRTPRKPGSIGFKLNEEFQFTLDAAASHANAMVNRYCTLEGTFERRCQQTGCTECLLAGDCLDFKPVQISKNDGLMPESWVDQVVFCNPPYVGDTIKDWVTLGNEHLAHKSAILLPPSIDTAWFRSTWPEQGTIATVRDTDEYHAVIFYWPMKGNEPLQIEREIRFMHGRVRFETPASGSWVSEDEFVWNEEDPESIEGVSPRAGNIVLVHYAKGHGPGPVRRKP